VNHLDCNKLLYDNQFGFQRGKSTEHNLIKAVNYIGDSINSGKFCIGVFFDLKKAFDVVSHDILLKKLHKMGIQGNALEWFKSYLNNRRQVVDINGSVSLSKKISISVLQGSILGPILFFVFYK
jgi:retron-type reverse transcriptase